MARMFPGMNFWQYKAMKEKEERRERERSQKVRQNDQ